MLKVKELKKEIKTILILLGLSILILTLSGINLINLKTAQASQRAKRNRSKKGYRWIQIRGCPSVFVRKCNHLYCRLFIVFCPNRIFTSFLQQVSGKRNEYGEYQCFCLFGFITDFVYISIRYYTSLVFVELQTG